MSSGSSRASPAAMSSAVYEGIVRHRRHAPRAHSFRYRLAQLFLDLDEMDRVFQGRWLWSRERRNLAEFRRSDYFGAAQLPLTEAVRQEVERVTGRRPNGPIRLLTHLRYAGYSFNPVSFYYCFAQDGATLECVLAEITNTPWRERHAYVLPIAAAQDANGAWQWQFSKEFHVSPFLPMERRYAWKFTTPADRIYVHMDVTDATRPEFDATLILRRRELDGAALRRVLWRYPLMSMQIIGAIHWQALRLWLKGNPVHEHPTNERS